MITPGETVIVFAIAGVAVILGTLAVVIAGAAPGVPPRGIVRTTWLGGKGVEFLSLAQTMSMAWLK